MCVLVTVFGATAYRHQCSDITAAYHAQIISGEPDVTVTQLTPEDEFVVIACDGVWDCFSNQEAVSDKSL